MAVYLGNELVLANGVGGTSLANGHASTHAKGGSDELAPADIGAAAEVHTHTEYALKPLSMVVELPLDGWVVGTYSCTQAISVDGMRSGKYAIVGPVPKDWDEYGGANVHCAVQGYNSLTFLADKKPATDLRVNVLIWG